MIINYIITGVIDPSFFFGQIYLQMEGAKHAESSDGIYDLRSENFQPATAGFRLFFSCGIRSENNKALLWPFKLYHLLPMELA